MSKISHTTSIRSETIEELLGADEYRKLMNEVNATADPIESDLPFLTASVVIDGWHVRAKLDRSGGNGSKELLSDWLDRLGSWLSDKHESGDNGLAISVVAWDSHLGKGQENSKAFQGLSEERQNAFLQSRSEQYANQRSIWLSADWNFTDLRKVGEHFVQSGVDARMATSIVEAAIEKPDFLYIVTADQDYSPAIELASKIAEDTFISVLTVGEGIGDELYKAAEYTWQIYPGYRGGGFAKLISHT